MFLTSHITVDGECNASEVANFETTTMRKRELESAIHYVVAILHDHILFDFDLLPLQSLSWQTHVVSAFPFNM